MFERFTDQARKVMVFANQEAQRVHHEFVTPEHMLLGILKEGGGVENLGIDPMEIRLEVEQQMTIGPDMVTMGNLPRTPAAKKVIEFAIEASRYFDHKYVGTEHLFVGLMRVEDTVAKKVLEKSGLTREKVNMAIQELSGSSVEKEKESPKKETEHLAIERLLALKDRFCAEVNYGAASKVRERIEKLRKRLGRSPVSRSLNIGIVGSKSDKTVSVKIDFFNNIIILPHTNELGRLSAERADLLIDVINEGILWLEEEGLQPAD